MKNPEIVPATPDLIKRFYGHAQPWTVRAFAAVLNGEPLCIAGVGYAEGQSVVFANVKPVMRERFKKTGVRLAKCVMQLVAERGQPVIALPDCGLESAPRFLEYLGFQRLPNGVYAWT
jgi:acetyl-CoA carboxylase carboxyltransferase component